MQLNTDEIIKEHSDNVRIIFDKFNIDAPVNKTNLENAIKAIPSIRNIMNNVFSDFEGNKEGGDNDFTIEFDAVTGEEKKVKRKKVMKDVFGFAKDTVTKAINKNKYVPEDGMDTGAMTKKELEEFEKSKKPKTIFGMSQPLFIGLCIVIFLIIVAVILKSIKK